MKGWNCNRWLICGPDLVEAIFAAITNVDDFDDFGPQPGVEHVALAQFCLEVRATCQDKPSHIDLVVGDEVLNS
jgi:hypothetical protein